MKHTKISLTIAAALSLASGGAMAITNGIATDSTEVPYQVHITADYGAENLITCGGVAITDSVVLTSAQCVGENSDGISPTGVKVSYVVNGELNEVPINSRDIKVHDEWTGNLADGNDLALLYSSDHMFSNLKVIKAVDKLEHEDMLSEFANTYAPNQENEPNVLVTGFEGEEQSSAESLQKVMMSGVSDSSCQDLKVSNSNDADTICVVSYDKEVNRSICQGDRGGPLIWKNPINAADSDFGLRLAGISSYIYGPEDSFCKETTEGYVGFTPIEYHKDWINLTIEDFVGGSFDYNDLDVDYSFDADPMYSPDDSVPPVDGGDETDNGNDGDDSENGGSSGDGDDAKLEEAVNKSSGGSMGGIALLALSALGFTRRRKS